MSPGEGPVLTAIKKKTVSPGRKVFWALLKGVTGDWFPRMPGVPYLEC